MHFIFFQPPFLNGMRFVLNSLRHITKTKVIFDALLNELSLSKPIGLGHSLGQRYYQNKTELR